MRRRILGGAAVAATALAACAGLALTACAGEKTVEDPKGPIDVSDGEALVVEMRVNPSVGTDWRLGERVRGPLELDGVDTEIDDPDAAGSGGTKSFRFEARREGRTELVLVQTFRGDVRERRRVPVVVR